MAATGLVVKISCRSAPGKSTSRSVGYWKRTATVPATSDQSDSSKAKHSGSELNIAHDLRHKSLGIRISSFGAAFVVYFLLLFGLSRTPPIQAAIDTFTRVIAALAATLFHLLGSNTSASGMLLINPGNRVLLVAHSCSGVDTTILLWAALLASPASWSRRTRGLAVAAIAVQAVNVMRILALIYLFQHKPDWFSVGHLIGEALMDISAVAVYYSWIAKDMSRMHV